MKLNQPIRRPSLNTEERVAFNTSEPVKADTQPSPPPLVKTESASAFPKLERVQKKQIELSPPQPVAESKATIEPDQSGGVPKLRQEKPAVEWPFKDKDGGQASEAKPSLEPAQGASVPNVIPKLQITKGDGEAQKVEIPKLDAYNKMEVVHLLLGRSADDEEIVLLQSFSERFVRTKKKDEFDRSLFDRISKHYGDLVLKSFFDFHERSANRELQVHPVTPQLSSKGVEWIAAVKDDGEPSIEDVRGYAEEEGITLKDASSEVQESGLFKKSPSYVYTWALVKVKIGHDFGSYKLSELMPNL